jgi:hypothetical protein
LTVRSLIQFFNWNHAHNEPSSARIDVTINEHVCVSIDAGLEAPHGRDTGDSPKIARQ